MMKGVPLTLGLRSLWSVSGDARKSAGGSVARKSAGGRASKSASIAPITRSRWRGGDTPLRDLETSRRVREPLIIHCVAELSGSRRLPCVEELEHEITGRLLDIMHWPYAIVHVHKWPQWFQRHARPAYGRPRFGLHWVPGPVPSARERIAAT